MKPNRSHTIKSLYPIALAALIMALAGFCILSNSSGVPRTYPDSAIPLIYQLNDSTPSSFIPSIEAAHKTWNDVPSSYWEFARGPFTAVNAPGQDGVNLLFFDTQGVNFASPTNVIAFSRTFTSSTGGYHAVESDLVWNARDYPPSPTGESNKIDLQTVVTHELGHHFGLDHTGLPSGASSGCGPQVPAAVMWWATSAGQLRRSLHPDDIMGVSVLYPVWKLQGTVTFNGSTPAANTPIHFVGTYAAVVGTPEKNPNGTWYNESGTTLDTLRTDSNGNYISVVTDQSFDVTIEQFGYEHGSAHVQFSPPGGIGQTQVLTLNFNLQPKSRATMSGIVRDARTLAGVPARLEFYGIGDPQGLTLTTTSQANGTYTAQLPSQESYRIVIYPAAPYVDSVGVSSVSLPVNGTTADFDIPRAQVLLVDEDGGDTFERTYQSSCDRLNFPRRTFSIADSGAALPAVISRFTEKPTVIWFTGRDSVSAPTAAERLLLLGYLASGGRVLMTGQNIAESSPAEDSLLVKTFGVQFNGNTSQSFLRGFAGDIIGNGVVYLITGGPAPQNSKDMLSLISGSTGSTTKALYYGSSTADSNAIAGVHVVGPGEAWRAVLFGFGLEGLPAVRQDTLIARSIRFFNQSLTAVNTQELKQLPDAYGLAQNYPNPFNPSTQIEYTLPEQGRVVVTLYTETGQKVRALYHGVQEAGVHTLQWDARDDRGVAVASGIYITTLEATTAEGKSIVQSRKMLLLK